MNRWYDLGWPWQNFPAKKSPEKNAAFKLRMRQTKFSQILKFFVNSGLIARNQSLSIAYVKICARLIVRIRKKMKAAIWSTELSIKYVKMLLYKYIIKLIKTCKDLFKKKGFQKTNLTIDCSDLIWRKFGFIQRAGKGKLTLQRLCVFVYCSMKVNFF